MKTHAISQQAETQRISSNIVYFAVIGSTFITVFAAMAIYRQDWQLAVILSLFFIFCLGVAVYTYLTKNIKLTRILASIGSLLLYFYLLLDGAYQNTGYMWCFALSPVPYFLLGHFKGIIISTSVILLTIIILYTPDFPLLVADYPEAIKLRFPGAYLAVSILFFIQEYSRYKADLLVSQLTSQLETISLTDELTQIPNRRALQEFLQQKLAKLKRYKQSFGVILLDIDHFKQVNDQYGHYIGDKVLLELGVCCTKSLRGTDIFGRWGGEEFLFILSQVNSAQVKNISEKIRHICKAISFESEDNHFNISVSLGAYLVTEYESSDNMFKQIDIALYKAKEQGRDQTVMV